MGETFGGVRPLGIYIDEVRSMDPVKPPQFTSQTDADAWLAVNDVPRQLYPIGALVTWDRRVELVQSPSGVVLPHDCVEFVGKVVSWKSVWRLSTHNSEIPHYQLLTKAWVSDDLELVWVAAHEVKGLA